MAYSTHPTPAFGGFTLRTVAGSILHGFSAFFRGIGRAIEANSVAQTRFAQVQRLQEKTDAELAELNIKREDIVHHAFRDLYGL